MQIYFKIFSNLNKKAHLKRQADLKTLAILFAL